MGFFGGTSSSSSSGRPISPVSTRSSIPSWGHHSRASSSFSHDSFVGPTTPKADYNNNGLPELRCVEEWDESDIEGLGKSNGNGNAWWELTPRPTPLRSETDQDTQVCPDDSPTIPTSKIALDPMLFVYPESKDLSMKSMSTETLRIANELPRRRLDYLEEKESSASGSHNDLSAGGLGLQGMRMTENQPAVRGQYEMRPTLQRPFTSDAIPTISTISTTTQRPTTPARSISSRSIRSNTNSPAPSIPSRTSSRRPPAINSRGSSLKLERAGSSGSIPTPKRPFHPSSSTSSSAIYDSSEIHKHKKIPSLPTTSINTFPKGINIPTAPPALAISGSRNPITSLPLSRSSSSGKSTDFIIDLKPISEIPSDLVLTPSGDWALRPKARSIRHFTSKSTPDLHRIYQADDIDIEMSLRIKIKQKLAGTPSLHTDFNSNFSGSGNTDNTATIRPRNSKGKDRDRDDISTLGIWKSRILSSSSSSSNSNSMNPNHSNWSQQQQDFIASTQRSGGYRRSTRPGIMEIPENWRLRGQLPPPPPLAVPRPYYYRPSRRFHNSIAAVNLEEQINIAEQTLPSSVLLASNSPRIDLLDTSEFTYDDDVLTGVEEGEIEIIEDGEDYIETLEAIIEAKGWNWPDPPFRDEITLEVYPRSLKITLVPARKDSSTLPDLDVPTHDVTPTPETTMDLESKRFSLAPPVDVPGVHLEDIPSVTTSESDTSVNSNTLPAMSSSSTSSTLTASTSYMSIPQTPPSQSNVDANVNANDNEEDDQNESQSQSHESTQSHSTNPTSSIPISPSTTTLNSSSKSTTRSKPKPKASQVVDLLEEITKQEEEEEQRAKEEEKAKAIANGTWVDPNIPRAKTIGFVNGMNVKEGVPEPLGAGKRMKLKKKEKENSIASGEKKVSRFFRAGLSGVL